MLTLKIWSHDQISSVMLTSTPSVKKLVCLLSVTIDTWSLEKVWVILFYKLKMTRVDFWIFRLRKSLRKSSQESRRNGIRTLSLIFSINELFLPSSFRTPVYSVTWYMSHGGSITCHNKHSPKFWNPEILKLECILEQYFSSFRKLKINNFYKYKNMFS